MLRFCYYFAAMLCSVNSFPVTSFPLTTITTDLNASDSTTMAKAPPDDWADIGKQLIDVAKKIFTTSQGEIDEVVKDTSELLEKSLAPIAADIANLKDKSKSVNTSVTNLEATTAVLANTQSDLHTTIVTDLRPAIGGIRTDLNVYSQNVNSYHTEIIGMQVRIIKEIQTSELNMQTQMGSMQTEVGSMKTDMGSMKTSLGNINKKLDDLISILQPFIHPTTTTTTTTAKTPPSEFNMIRRSFT